MRRTSAAGIALALVLVPALASTASASPLLTLRDDGGTFVREDPYLPPPEPGRPQRAAAAGGAGERRARAASAGAPRLSVRGELARMLAAGVIEQATHDAHRSTYYDALKLRGKLRGARRNALGAVLRNLEDIAAGGGLTVTRLPVLFETVARNRQWWASGPLLGYGTRVGFQGSRLVWQHYTGEGLQIQWLATFGRANGLWSGGYDASLRELLDEALALAAQRAGGIAWEYLFRFDGGRPPWVSGLAQGTAVQALARAAVRLNEPRFFDASRAGLGVFREPPPSGVRIATPAGAHYLIYSFARDLRVLNAFTQALNGLHDFAVLANDAEGRALFEAGDAQLRSELPAYDTGSWSRYSNQREADLSYHKLSRDFLRNLCTRLTDATVATPMPAAPTGGAPAPAAAAAPATGGAVPVAAPASPLEPVADPAPYCSVAQRFTSYLSQPPALKLVSRRTRAGRPAVLKLDLSKPSYVTLTVRSGDRAVVTLGGRFASGRRTLRWPQPPRGGGDFDVVLRATDLAGNRGAAEATLQVLKARRGR